MSEPIRGRGLTEKDVALPTEEDLLDESSPDSPPPGSRPPQPPPRQNIWQRLNPFGKTKVEIVEGPDADKIIEDVFAEVGIKTKKKKELSEPEGMPKDPVKDGVTAENLATSTNPLDQQLGAEVEEANEAIEKAKNPEVAKKILDELDADALLVRRVLESKKGLKGLINSLDSSKIGRILKSANMILATSAGIIAVRTLTPAAGLSSPVFGAVVGGAMGALGSYIKSKKIVEGTSNWQAQLGILGEDVDLKDKSVGELEVAIGVLGSAIREKRVRGSETELFQLARKYREIRQILSENKKALEGLDDAIETEAQIGKLISDGAKEEYKDLYAEIIKGKKKQVWGSMLKGAAVGALSGAAIGWLVQHFSASVPSAGDQTLIEAKSHVATGQPDRLAGDLQKFQDLQQIKSATEGLGIESHFSEANQAFFNHMSALQSHNGLQGFSPEHLTQFGEMVKTANPASLAHEAALHNIDLSAFVDQGQTQHLVDFITANKEAFLNSTPEIQRGILSYPSLAQEILNHGAKEAAAAATAKLVGAIGLAGITGMGILGWMFGKKGSAEAKAGWEKVATKAGEPPAPPVIPPAPTPPEPPTEKVAETKPAPVVPPIVPEIPPTVSALSLAGESDKEPESTQEPLPVSPPEERIINNEEEADKVSKEALLDFGPKWQILANDDGNPTHDKFELGVDYKIISYSIGHKTNDLLVALKRVDNTGKEIHINKRDLMKKLRYDEIKSDLFDDAIEAGLSAIEVKYLEQKEKAGEAKKPAAEKPAGSNTGDVAAIEDAKGMLAKRQKARAEVLARDAEAKRAAAAIAEAFPDTQESKKNDNDGIAVELGRPEPTGIPRFENRDDWVEYYTKELVEKFPVKLYAMLPVEISLEKQKYLGGKIDYSKSEVQFSSCIIATGRNVIKATRKDGEQVPTEDDIIKKYPDELEKAKTANGNFSESIYDKIARDYEIEGPLVSTDVVDMLKFLADGKVVATYVGNSGHAVMLSGLEGNWTGDESDLQNIDTTVFDTLGNNPEPETISLSKLLPMIAFQEGSGAFICKFSAFSRKNKE